MYAHYIWEFQKADHTAATNARVKKTMGLFVLSSTCLHGAVLIS
jgi:hypothetical protein